ncbi:MAG: hypothetical protein ACI8T1_003248 [Verrucomicrobiales bacterium]
MARTTMPMQGRYDLTFSTEAMPAPCSCRSLPATIVSAGEEQGWLAYALLTAEKGFNKVKGCSEMPRLMEALKVPISP